MLTSAQVTRSSPFLMLVVLSTTPGGASQVCNNIGPALRCETTASYEDFRNFDGVIGGRICRPTDLLSDTFQADEGKLECSKEVIVNGKQRHEHKWLFKNLPAGHQCFQYEGHVRDVGNNEEYDLFQWFYCDCDEENGTCAGRRFDCRTNVFFIPSTGIISVPGTGSHTPGGDQKGLIPIPKFEAVTVEGSDVHWLSIDKPESPESSTDTEADELYIDHLLMITVRDWENAAADHGTGPGIIVSGDYSDTARGSGANPLAGIPGKQVLREVSDQLQHSWKFENIPSGVEHELVVEASHPGSVDNEVFQFQWSTDPNFVPGYIVSEVDAQVPQFPGGPFTVDQDTPAFEAMASFPFDGSASGTIYVRIHDISPSGVVDDTVEIGEIWIRTRVACEDLGCSGGTTSFNVDSCSFDTTTCSGCCGDATCVYGEDCQSCPEDCLGGVFGAWCGNGLCESADGEDCVSCPSDCDGVQGGSPQNRYCCGDGDGDGPVTCDDSRCTSNGFACTNVLQGPTAIFCCGNGQDESSTGEVFEDCDYNL